MAKKTNRSTCGTSFHDTVLRTSIATLKELYGDPTCDENSGEDKVNVEWEMVLTEESDTEGAVFTIYDWKEYRVLDENEIVEFHIGGSNRYITNSAYEEIILDLKQIS